MRKNEKVNASLLVSKVRLLLHSSTNFSNFATCTFVKRRLASLMLVLI